MSQPRSQTPTRDPNYLGDSIDGYAIRTTPQSTKRARLIGRPAEEKQQQQPVKVVRFAGVDTFNSEIRPTIINDMEHGSFVQEDAERNE
jgi:hypothetical protein